MKKPPLSLILILSAFLIAAHGLAAVRSRGRSTREQFLAFRAAHPESVFAPSVSKKVRACLRDYESGALLPNGLVYGGSVRRYALDGKSARQVRADMKALRCPLREDVLREPRENRPILYRGRTIPMWAFLCPDGGVVRVKPDGDPSSSYRPEPHAIKSLRYPFDSSFTSFADEIVKVDEQGNAIPKSRADLDAPGLVDGWADDGHTDLRP